MVKVPCIEDLRGLGIPSRKVREEDKCNTIHTSSAYIRCAIIRSSDGPHIEPNEYLPISCLASRLDKPIIKYTMLNGKCSSNISM